MKNLNLALSVKMKFQNVLLYNYFIVYTLHNFSLTFGKEDILFYLRSQSVSL